MRFNKERETVDELIAKVIKEFGFRHQYEVAKYFGVTAQTLSGWVKSGMVPDKYVMKFQLDIQEKHKKNNHSENILNKIELDNRDFITPISKSQMNDFSFTVFFANYIRQLIVFPFIFSIITLVSVFFIIRPVYTSTAKVLPIGDNNGSFSDMAGMASQLGLSMPMNFNNEIPWDEMFPEIIKSEKLAKEVLIKNFTSRKYGENQSLFSIIEREYKLKNKTENFLENMIIHEFNKMIRVSKSRLSPIVTIELDFFEPQVSAEILDKVVEISGKTQVKIKLKQISEKRQFIEERISEVMNALKKAEIDLKEFKESNRRADSSPSLKLDESRLEREVSLQTTLYMTLKSQYENVKIEEVKESAMIQVIDGPIVPFRVTSPKKTLSVIFTFIFTFLGVFFIFYIKDYNISGSQKDFSKRNEAKSKLFKNIKSLFTLSRK
jgi:uncharacterized protein involved in exopolysaccharide biosynthesis